MATVFTILLPVFGLIAAGYGIAHTRLLSAEGARGIGNFVYYLAIPALLFHSLALGGVGEAGHGRIIAAYFLGAVIVFALGLALGRWGFGVGLREQGVLAVNASFGNTVQMGVPLVLAAFGPPGLRPLTLIIALHAIVLLTLATVVIELGRGRGGIGGTLRAAMAALATNPIILAIVVGFLWSLTHWPLPAALAEFLNLLGAAASPCALFALGAALSRFRLASGAHESAAIVGLKLLLQPLLVWGLGHLFGLAPLDLAVATVAAALPIGMNAFILAQRYEVYVARSASAVVLSNLLSMLTLAAVIAIFAPR